jgi:hypothetical protein
MRNVAHPPDAAAVVAAMQRIEALPLLRLERSLEQA